MEQGRRFGFCKGDAAMETFVELVASAVLSSFSDVLSFFLQIIFAPRVLAGDVHSASWSCHKALMRMGAILIHLN